MRAGTSPAFKGSLPFHPPIEGTALCNNEITDGYDLQIIVPVYNVQEYVKACMDSVVLQKSKYKFLVVAVNDGSTDRSREILAQYASFGHVRIIDQENRGFSGARNAGLSHIEARYLTFVDSDDVLLPCAIDHLMDAALKYDADIVEGGFDNLTGSSRSAGIRHTFYEGSRWTGRLYGQPWGKVIRSSKMAHLHFPEHYWFEDTLMAMALYPQCHNFVTIPEPVYLYRNNPDSISHRCAGRAKSLDTLYVTLQLLADAAKLNLKADGQQYDHFLNQVKINQNRIVSLENPRIDRDVFEVHCRLYHQLFSNFSTADLRLSGLEKALRQQDYGRYMVECMIG